MNVLKVISYFIMYQDIKISNVSNKIFHKISIFRVLMII